MSQKYRCISLVKIHTFFQETGCRQAISNNLSLNMTLKMGSRSPKTNHLFSMFQQYRCTRLVKILPIIQEIGCRQAIFQQSKPSCDLENGVKVTKSNQFFSMSQQSICAIFGQNPFVPSGDRVQASLFPAFFNNLSPRLTLKIGSMSPKSNQLFFPTQ